MSSCLQDRRVLAGSLAAAALAAFIASPWGQPVRQGASALVHDSFKTKFLSLGKTKTEEHYDAGLSFDEFLDKQAEIAWEHLRANIHPEGTAPGCIVASPSKNKPDYWYQMNSALVMRAVIQKWRLSDKGSQEEQELLKLLLDFVDATVDMQHRETPSGGFRDGGLGEVKFYVNREPFLGPWGRPQRDGPALRASLLMAFARHYTNTHGAEAKTLVGQKLWNSDDGAIKADLDYVEANWQDTDFDLWEETQGTHFYTVMVQMRAMKEGAIFAQSHGDVQSSHKYSATAEKMNNKLESFWDDENGYLRVIRDVVNDHGKTSGLDTSTVMAVLHAGVEAGQWSVDNPKVLLTQLAVVESMRHTYPLSKRYHDQYAVPLGRYKEDVYDGVATSRANPWYLCTLYHAEYLYRLAATLKTGAIDVPSDLRSFYSGLLVSPLSEFTTSIPLDSPVHDAITSSLRARADDFVRIVREWKSPDGSMSEQYSQRDGSPQGAQRLTWSYAAFLSMRAARDTLPAF